MWRHPGDGLRAARHFASQCCQAGAVQVGDLASPALALQRLRTTG
jgi:hypothetical protein